MDEEVLKGKTLLIVDDEVDLRDIISSEMEFMGAKVHQAGNVSGAKEVLAQHSVDLIVSDIRMPGGTGIDLLEFVKAQQEQLPVILITGFADITPEDAFNKGAEALLNKPFKLDDLIRVVERNTRSFTQRFVDPSLKTGHELSMDFSLSFNEALTEKKFSLGRGGASFALIESKRKVEAGDSVSFNFRFKDVIFSGVGIYRWSKFLDRHLVGLEFVHLNPESLRLFEEALKSSGTKSYIPRI